MDSDDLLYAFLIVIAVPVLTFALMPLVEKIARRVRRRL